MRVHPKSELARILDDRANGTDEVNYDGHVYRRRGRTGQYLHVNDPRDQPGPWRRISKRMSLKRNESVRNFVDDLLEVSSSENPTKLKKDAEGEDCVDNAAEKYARGTVPNHDGGKTETTAGRKYWKDVKGKVAHVGNVFYSKDDAGWHEVYWTDNEGDEAIEHLTKLSKPSGLPEAIPMDGLDHGGNLMYRKNAFTDRYFVGTQKKVPGRYKINPRVAIKPGTETTVQSGMPESKASKKVPTKTTFSKTFFGKKYKPNMAVVGEDTPPGERRGKFENFLANLSTKELENYVNRYGPAFENVEGPEDWHVKMLKHYVAHHGLKWPEMAEMPESFNEGGGEAEAASADEEEEGASEGASSTSTTDESFALLPDPGIKVVYEDIDSLVVDEAVKLKTKKCLQNDTKCTLLPRKK